MSTTIDDAQPRRSRRPDAHAGKGDVIPSVGDHAARRGPGSRGTGGPAVFLALLSGSLWIATPLRLIRTASAMAFGNVSTLLAVVPRPRTVPSSPVSERATTGHPQARASIATLGNPSYSEARTRASAEW